MTAFVVADVAIGGQRHYVEIIHADATFSQLVHVLDDLGADTQTYIMGVTFRPPTGDLFTVSTPSQTAPNTPHDVDWFPNDTGLLVPVVPSTGVLEFRKYDYLGNVLATWSPAVEDGWAQEPVKVSIACDSRTVFYTQSLHKVQRFDLQTGLQLTDYEVLPDDSPYIYGGLRVVPGASGDNRAIIVAMSLSGDGPQRALCLISRALHWVDEIHPISGIYHIVKKDNVTGATITQVVTKADPGDDNDITLSLACYVRLCGGAFAFGSILD